MSGGNSYRGTVAVNRRVPGAAPVNLVLALDLRDGGTALRGVWGADPGTEPQWLAVTDTRSRHNEVGSGGSGHAGTSEWHAELTPGFAPDARAVLLTPVAPPRPGVRPGTAPGPIHLGEALEVALPETPPLRTATATAAPHRPRRSAIWSRLSGRPTAPLDGPDRVIAVSTLLDSGRAGAPYVASIVAWLDCFGLTMTWDTHVNTMSVLGTGWEAVDDLGGGYHGVPKGSAGIGGASYVDFVFIPALDPRAGTLTVTLPDTQGHALTATLDVSGGAGGT